MNEQTIILIFLVMALGITLWLYILKAIKQVNYKGDERWKLIDVYKRQAEQDKGLQTEKYDQK